MRKLITRFVFLASVILFLFQCSEMPEPSALSQAPGRSFTYWVSGDSIILHGFANINQDTSGGDKESMVTDTAVLDWLWKVLPTVLDLAQYLDNDTTYQTLTLVNDSIYISGGNGISLADYLDNDTVFQTISIVNDSLFISDGNGVSLADYVGGGSEIADTLHLIGPNPVVVFDDTDFTNKDFSIRNVGGLLQVTNNSTVLHNVDSDGRLGIGGVAPTEAKLFIYGGSNGANVDARADDAFETSTFEVQPYNYTTTLNSAGFQYVGDGVGGNVFDAIPYADLAQIWFMADNAVIYTQNTAPIIFGTNFDERMRIKGNGIISMTGVSTFADNAAALSGSLVAGDIYKTSDGTLKIVF